MHLGSPGLTGRNLTLPSLSPGPDGPGLAESALQAENPGRRRPRGDRNRRIAPCLPLSLSPCLLVSPSPCLPRYGLYSPLIFDGGNVGCLSVASPGCRDESSSSAGLISGAAPGRTAEEDEAALVSSITSKTSGPSWTRSPSPRRRSPSSNWPLTRVPLRLARSRRKAASSPTRSRQCSRLTQ